MYQLPGLSVTTGIAIGKAVLIKDRTVQIEETEISEHQIEEELAFFKTTIDAVIVEIDQFIENFNLINEDKNIIETHKMILQDPDFIASVENLVRKERKNLEQAIYIHFMRAIDYFKNLDNQLYAERACDYEDVFNRLMMHLKKIDSTVVDDISEGDIVVVSDIPPSMVSQIHKKGATGIILSKGSKTSHSIIIARALGLPIITGVKFQHIIHNDDVLILDAKKGFVIVNPSGESLKQFIELQKKIALETSELVDYIELIPTSANSEQIKILSNIDLPIEVDHILGVHSDGIGLFRTESFYIDRKNLPSEEEQYLTYKSVAEKLGERPFIIRTIDIGGDKVASWYAIEKEVNPNLGCRGIRFSLKYQSIFKMQLRAILMASAFGNVSIMFPMVSSVEEFTQARAVLQECKDDLHKANIAFNDNIPVGSMIETPSAAISSEALAKVCDFFSIGTNDLLQYTVAVDRSNEKIAGYYNHYNPAFLTLILKSVQSAKKYNIPVAICGEMAADTQFTAFLLNAGIRELSVGFDHTLKLKKYIRSVDTQKAVPYIEKLHDCLTLADTEGYINTINQICVDKGFLC